MHEEMQEHELLEDKNTIIYCYSTRLDPTSTFGKEDGQEKKSNIYKKMWLCAALWGRKVKEKENKKIRTKRMSGEKRCGPHCKEQVGHQ